jgi:DNA-binding MarR family transcriptional regulator
MEGPVEGLTASQWAALRYFAQANRFSRTPSAFAAFHGTTRGTASQTIKSIETLGYLTRIRSEDDRRSVKFVLTEKAMDILANDPLESLVRATDSLPHSLRKHFSEALQRMVGQVAKERGKPPFGTCTSCRHLKCHNCSRDEQMPYECGLTRAPLILEELDGVCINFAPGNPITIPSVS